MAPKRNEPQLRDPDLYEKLRSDGASKEKAARISNAAANKGRSAVGRSGGRSGSYDDWTVADLRARAKELGLHGYSSSKKADLIDALRNHCSADCPARTEESASYPDTEVNRAPPPRM